MLGLLKFVPKITKIAPEGLQMLRAATTRVGGLLGRGGAKAAQSAHLADDAAAVGAKAAIGAADDVALAGAKSLRQSAGSAGFLGKPVTRGSMMAFGAAGAIGPTALALVDNASGNAISGTLLKTPVGKPLEYLLTFNTWSNNQQANVISANLTDQLIERGKLSAEDPNFERSQRIISALSHAAIGDPVGAASIVAQEDIAPEDVLAAMNKARDEHPDADLQTQLGFAFQNLKDTEQARSVAQTAQASTKTSQAVDSRGAASSVGSAFGASSASAAAAAGAVEPAPSLRTRFEGSHAPATDERDWSLFDGMGGGLQSFLSGVAGVFQFVADMAQRLWDFMSDLISGDQIGQGNLHLAGARAPMAQFQPKTQALEHRPELS